MVLEQKKKKVLIIQSLIPHYRVPIFNEIAKSVDLTVVYDKGSEPVNVEFETRKIDVIHIKHIPRIHKKNLLHIAKKYDVVISMLDNSYLTTRLLCRFRGKTKLILWGIGVAAGYKMRFDSMPEMCETFCKMIHSADAALFYSQYPVEKYISMGIPKEKLFVANNTVNVLPSEDTTKDYILFVGSLYKAKKIFELLNCYKNAYDTCPDIPKLVVVGDGEERENILDWISKNRLEEQIILTGGVYDEKELSNIYSHAIMCISPDQAGLAVLQSFGYGVPFVTHKDAITGGERLNIINDENGILLESFEEISKIICDCAKNTDHYIEMGKNAKKFYDECRTVEHMVAGFKNAIAYVTQN